MITKRFRAMAMKACMGVVSIATAWCAGACSIAVARDTQSFDQFVWHKDDSGTEVAASRSAQSLNFFDIGNLSPFSLDSVKQTLAKYSNVAGLSIDRNLHSKIAIFHDTNVFSRLKNDRRSFNAVGITDFMVDLLLRQITSGSSKCLTMTYSDDRDIYWTVILLSEQSNHCLIDGLLEAFGVRATAVDVEDLVNLCVLYEGRRLGVRDRQGLSREAAAFRKTCLSRFEQQK